MKKQFMFISVVKQWFLTYKEGSENYPENGGYHEFIRINFAKEELDLKEYPLLVEYLGLEKELEDGILYYQEELLKSETFRYKLFLEEGNFSDNITLVGVSQYDYSNYN